VAVKSFVAGALVLMGAAALAQGDVKPTNDLPNPYESIENYFQLPDGRKWGSTSSIEIGKDGKSIWIAERCGGNSLCVGDPTTGKMSDIDPILHYDASGKLIKAFGRGVLVSPHGIFVDKDGNVWVTDYQDNAPRAARGAGGGRGAGRADAAGGGAAAAGGGAAAGAAGAAGGSAAAGAQAAAGRGRGVAGPGAGATIGHQVHKFSPDGKLLMSIGKPGGALAPECCFQPNDVLVAPNGEIYVSLGHGGTAKSEIVKFAKDGKTIITRFGDNGTGQGQFDQPHALAMDSRGRLFVGDRNNNRIQIFDQNFKFIDEWKQFSRPSGVYIDSKDNIYVADSESESVSRNHDGWKRGIRVGSAKDGSVKYFIPDPNKGSNKDTPPVGTSAAEGVTADKDGIIYGAEVGPQRVMKYTMKK
jgi:sugar lactone lactonase YvrE